MKNSKSTISVFDDLANTVDKYNERATNFDPFFFFEPWDCSAPDQDVIEKAAEDGVDLINGDIIRLAGNYPRLFQSGMLLSKAPVSVAQGGSQIGKTISPLIESAIMVSHQLPFSLRYERGVKTEIKRQISKQNVSRFGRFDSRTGTFIDKDADARFDPESWDCGFITGAGIYPKEKFAPPGSQIWIGTLAESVKTTWWPKIAGDGKQRIFPVQFVDKTKGNDGANEGKLVVHCINDCRILIKTYEQKHTKFESEKAWMVVYDEEPTSKSIFVSGLEHGEYHRMSFTPLSGITWSKEAIFNKENKYEFYHATQYDSPYQDRRKINTRRSGYQPWERQSRIWGIHSEQSGDPFFDRRKVNLWTQKFTYPHGLFEFRPTGNYYKMVSMSNITDVPGLMDVGVSRTSAKEYNERSVWKVYEDRKKGAAYVVAVDCAEGSEDASQAQDRNSAVIGRQDEDSEKPVVVATLKSTLPTLAFARCVSYAMRYYNNALLASERGIGKDNEAFGQELDDYPYWFWYTTVNDKTNKANQRKGFCTTGQSREYIFELIRDWVDEHGDNDDPMLKDDILMKEIAGAVIGKTKGGTKSRCDHTRDGSLDMTVAFGILLYIFDKCQDQIRCNSYEDYDKRESYIVKRVMESQPEKPRYMGGGISSNRR